MDSVTSFIYGMSMMFFSMMAFLFWRKGKEMLFRMIMWLMIVVDLQLVKDMVFFLIYGFDNEHAWYLTSSLDMMIIPVLQLCIDGPGEAGLVQMAESFNAGIAFPLVAGVLYFYP